MAYEIYIDILFGINFLMDTLLLWTLKRILKLTSTPLRLALAGAVGALWACAAAAFPGIPRWLQAVGTYGAVSLLMTVTAFSPKHWRELAKELLGLYLLTILFGGVGAFLYWHAAPGIILVLLMAGSGFGLRYVFCLLREKEHRMYQVTLYYRGNKKEVTALLDTGNHLFDPVSRKPVSVLSGRAARELCSRVTGVIYIPYRSVGREHGLLPAVRMDAAEIRKGEFCLRVEAPLVGISKEMLSENDSFDMLLNEKLLY